MPLESEFTTLLTIGFITIIALVILATLTLWLRQKSQHIAYSMMLLHSVLLSLAFYFFINVMSSPLPASHPMASEENSWQLSIAATCWAGSMIVIFIAIMLFVKATKKGASA